MKNLASISNTGVQIETIWFAWNGAYVTDQTNNFYLMLWIFLSLYLGNADSVPSAAWLTMATQEFVEKSLVT